MCHLKNLSFLVILPSFCCCINFVSVLLYWVCLQKTQTKAKNHLHCVPHLAQLGFLVIVPMNSLSFTKLHSLSPVFPFSPPWGPGWFRSVKVLQEIPERRPGENLYPLSPFICLPQLPSFPTA